MLSVQPLHWQEHNLTGLLTADLHGSVRRDGQYCQCEGD